MNPTRAVINNYNAIAPQKVAASLRNAAITGSKNIKTFKSDYQSEDMKTLWQKVNSSEFPQGEDVWTRDYAKLVGALKVEQDDLVKDESGEEQGNALVKSDDADVLRIFRDSHPKLAAKSLEEGRVLPIELTIDGSVFVIERAGTNKGKQLAAKLKSGASASGETKDVLKYIEREHASETLSSMLSLLSSYGNVKTTPCQKCGKVFGADLQLPLVRKRKEGSSKDGLPIWIPLHHSCLF